MRSNDARRRILSDHAGIRIMVADLEAIAVRLRSGEEQLSEPLRRMCRRFFNSLERHLDLEDVILVRMFRESGEQGSAYAGRLEAEHREQRVLLAYLRERCDNSAIPPILLVQDVLHLAALLRDDMRQEEAALSDRKLFWDKGGAIHQLSG